MPASLGRLMLSLLAHATHRRPHTGCPHCALGDPDGGMI